MRLKRIAVYRATRVLSWVLPVLILAFVSIAGWSYRTRARDLPPPSPMTPGVADDLPSDVVGKTNDLQYSISEGVRDLFGVRASQMLGYKDHRKLMQDVAVLIHPTKDDDPEREIHGDQCTHEEETNRVLCVRNVSVNLEPRTIAHTQQLSYEPGKGAIFSPVQTRLDRKGEMSGTAGKMEYFIDPGLMRLTENFDIRLTRGGGLRGGSAVFQYKENWATVSQGLELTSTNGKIDGGSGRAELVPGTYHPKKVTVEGGARAEAPAFTVDSDWLESELSDSGDIEHVIGRGNGRNVRAVRKDSEGSRGERGSSEDSLNGTLTAPEIEAWLEGGVVKIIEARNHPEFVGNSGTTLKASGKIRSEPAGGKPGSLRTEGTSSFRREGLSIDGRDFVIEMKDEAHEQVFNTAARATLKSGGLETTADTTAARFDTKAKALSAMEQNGNVTFKEDKGGRSGASGKLTVLDGGDRIEMERNDPHFTDGQNTLHASRILMDRKRETFVGDGAGGRIRMTSTESGSNAAPTVVVAGHVEGSLGAENQRMEYTRAVQMTSGEGNQLDADRLTVFPKDKRFEAEGKVVSRASAGSNAGSNAAPAVVFAGRVEGSLEGDNQRMVFTRTVQMYPGDGSQIDTDRLTLSPKQKSFTAEGKVVSRASDQLVKANRLEFEDSGGDRKTAHYTGAVTLSGSFAPTTAGKKTEKKLPLELNSDGLDVESKNGDIDRIVASGNVSLTQGDRKGRGNRLEYNVVTGEILLMGTNSTDAEVSDAQGFLKGCAIQIAADGSRTVKSCGDRSVTSSVKIKN